MATVELTCIKCGKVTEVEGEDFLDMKKRGLILNPSYRGKGKQIDCCGGTKIAPSRGKQKSKAKTPTKSKPPAKASTKAKEPSTTRTIGEHKIFVIEGKFPKTLKIDGKQYSYVIYTKNPVGVVKNLKNIQGVDARIVQSGSGTFKPLYAVYVDPKQFKYAHVHVKGHGHVIVYKDYDNPPKQIKMNTKAGIVSITKLVRVKGTIRDINEQIFEADPDIVTYYKSKVFGLGGVYLPKTFDIFVDKDSKKGKQSTKPRLSRDYQKYVKRFGKDPHCSACTNPNCDQAGVSGDDACGSGFRSGL